MVVRLRDHDGKPSLCAAIRIVKIAVQAFRTNGRLKVAQSRPAHLEETVLSALDQYSKPHLTRNFLAEISADDNPSIHVGLKKYERFRQWLDSKFQFSSGVSTDCAADFDRFRRAAPVYSKHDMELVGLGERATRELTQTLHGWVEWAEQQHCRTENIPVDSYLQELLNREFIANLEHLIRRYLGWLLNFFVRQVLLQKLLIAILKHLSNTFGEGWFFEWPNCRPPLNATWPWNARPSLLVLWGVCWMFYDHNPAYEGDVNSEYAAFRPTEVPYTAAWAQGQGQQYLSQSQYASFPNATQRPRTNVSRHSSIEDVIDEAEHRTGAPPVADTAGRRWGPPRQTLDTSFSYIAYDPLLADSYIEGSPQELWNYRQEQPSNTQSGLSGTATGDEETRHWAAAGSVQYSTLTPSVSSPQPITPSIQIQGPDVVDNIPISPFPPRNGSSFDEAFCQYLSHLELGSPMHTNLPSPTSTHVDDDYQRTDFSEGSCPNASPAMEKSSPITPPRTRMMRVSSEGSSKGNPPRNEDNKMFCDHDECASDPPIFERRCEWSKHKDKHERPYHCEDPNCAKLQGFTYSGGLLRHQREVHREHGGPKEALMCPYDNCKRSSGAGFTRKENLNEHLRRVHKQSTVEGGVAWHDGAEALSPSRPDTVTQLPSTASAASLERKRKRSMAATGGSPSAARASSFRVDGGDEDLRAEFKRLKQSYEQISLQLHQLQEHTGFVQG